MARFPHPAHDLTRRWPRFWWALLIALILLRVTAPPIAQAASCQFVLGFAAMHDLLSQPVGQCLEDEHHNAVNGDGLQATAGGLLVWRKADNWTAFTDGYRTWVNGPNGMQQRLNSQRFAWEANPDGLSLAGPVAAARCDVADLTVVPGRVGAGAGNLIQTIFLTNTSGHPCQLHGFPGLQMFDAQDQPLPTIVKWGTGWMTSQPGPTDVVLAPAEVSSFKIHWEHIPVGDEPTCPTSDHVHLTPPDSYNFIVVPLHLDACGGGTLEVSAVRLGSGG